LRDTAPPELQAMADRSLAQLLKPDKIAELRGLLGPICLRRTKEDVNLELPPIFYQDIIVEPGIVNLLMCRSFDRFVVPIDRTKELEEILLKELGIVKGIVKGGFTNEAIAALKAASKSISTLRMYTGLQKVAPVVELVSQELESNAYEKIVLFTWHKDVTIGLFDGLKKKYGAQTIYGGSDPDKVEIKVGLFNRSAKNRVLIANVQTAGTSINLTSANQAMFVETSFVPADIAQAAARCHRIGQTKPVTVRFVGLANSIDQHIAQILRRKTSEIGAIMDGLTSKPKEKAILRKAKTLNELL
jgi:SWI/SNF-related matrix-associated actin-dependent regulator 1 of chromatin subfamily A